MWLVKGAPNLMQRLSRLPSTPDVTLLDCRKPKPFPWPHTTPPLETRLTSDGVASTYRMHPGNRTCGPRGPQTGFQEVEMATERATWTLSMFTGKCHRAKVCLDFYHPFGTICLRENS